MNKYIIWYNRFISRCRETNPDFKFENSHMHHIKPKCMNGTNDKDNLIYLTIEQHIIAHWLLAKAYPNHKIKFSLFKLSGNTKGFEFLQHIMKYCKNIVNQNGQHNHMSVCTNEEAKEIYYDFTNGTSLKDLSKKYNKTYQTICHICNGTTYKSITNASPSKYSKDKFGENTPNSKLTNEEVLEIVSLRDQGYKVCDLANKFCVNSNTISGILSGRRWSKITGIECNRRTKKEKEKDALEIVKLYEEGITIEELSKTFNWSSETIKSIVSGRLYYKVTNKKWISSYKGGPKTKLKEEDVKNIRKEFNNGSSIEELSKLYNKHQSSIERIVHYKTFKNVKE